MKLFRSSRSLKALRAELRYFLQILPLYDLRVAEVSAWSVGQQIEHATKVTRFALKIAEAEVDPPPGVVPAGFAAAYLLFSGRIPQGRQAPDVVYPKGITAEANEKFILDELAIIDRLLAKADILDQDNRKYHHPLLHGMPKSAWLRFAAIHQRHHYRIIKRIIDSAPAA